MKALIFNSGLGKRMGELTKNSPKSLVKLLNGETVFERQIRLLKDNGIKEFIVTTGPFSEQLINVTKKSAYKDLSFKFVHNDLYDKTNYIYSFYLASEFLTDDTLILHGDLVFDAKLVSFVLNNKNSSLGLINKNLPLPEKDFKARVINGKILEVGINIFDENCFAFQPFYKLSKKDLKIWLDSVKDFIENKQDFNVYAENAFNVVAHTMNVVAVSYDNYFINEIDNPQDFEFVSKEIQLADYRTQEIIYSITNLGEFVSKLNISRPLVVLDSFLVNSWITRLLAEVSDPVYFTDFRPNPDYEDVVAAVEVFKSNKCDSLVSIGGGSAIDTAKAVKLFLPLNERQSYLTQDTEYINLKHISIPTTAGTGSESTRYSVIYFERNKISLTQDFLIPDLAILETEFLKTLPQNQKKATLFDALCHAIESIWSVHATDESIRYASESVEIILRNIDRYFNNDELVYKDMLKAANLSGKAINLSQTTAAHALSYKLTSMYSVPHGQAVAICLPHLWELLLRSNQPSIIKKLAILDELFDENALGKYKMLLDKYNLKVKLNTNQNLSILVDSVNVTRLSNFPVKLTKEEISRVYVNLSK